MKAVRCTGLGDSSAKLGGASGRGEAGGKAARPDHTDPDAEQFLLYFKHVRPEFAGRPPPALSLGVNIVADRDPCGEIGKRCLEQPSDQGPERERNWHETTQPRLTVCWAGPCPPTSPEQETEAGGCGRNVMPVGDVPQVGPPILLTNPQWLHSQI